MDFGLSTAFRWSVVAYWSRIPRALLRLSQEHAGSGRFARFLNRLLFELVKPQTRYQIFQRFYRVLDKSAIALATGLMSTEMQATRLMLVPR